MGGLWNKKIKWTVGLTAPKDLLFQFAIGQQGLATITPEQKQAAVESFTPKINQQSRPVAQAKSNEEPDYYSPPLGRARYYKDGDNFVWIIYRNNSNFPTKYYSDRRYEENTSDVFYEQTNAIILDHYLGAEHRDLMPEVTVVFKRAVSIKFKVNDAARLPALLENDDILRVNHANYREQLEQRSR